MKLFASILLILSIFFSGCTYKKKFLPITHYNQASHTNVGLSVLNNNISIKNNVNYGVLHSIGHGFLECAGFGEFGMAGVGITILCLPINMPMKIVKATEASEDLKILKKEKATIEAKIKDTSLQKIVKNIAIDYANKNMINMNSIDENTTALKENGFIDYSLLSLKGIDTVLEYEIVEISLNEVGVTDIPVFLTLKMKNKLIQTKNNHILNESEKSVNSNIHPYKELVADEFKILKEEQNRLLEAVVSDSINENLLLYYPSLSRDLTANKRVDKVKRKAPYYVLGAYRPKPIFATPDMREIFSLEYSLVGNSDRRFVPINERQPLLKWEAFPWAHDMTPSERFSEIVYDLKIYEYEGPLIYTRNGLKKSEHKIEKLLKINTRYLWTVRARFKLDGKPRFTEWGGLYGEGYRYKHGYNSAWEFKERNQAWKFGEKGHDPLDRKKYYFYPFVIFDK